MLHTVRFSLQNAVYFIMLPFLVHVLVTFYIQVCQILNVKLLCQKVNGTAGTDIAGTSLFIYDVGLFNDTVCGVSCVVRLHIHQVFEYSYVVIVLCVCGASHRLHLLDG
jgi:hypothetical protein